MAKYAWALALQGDSIDLEDAVMLWGIAGAVKVEKMQQFPGLECLALFAEAFDGCASATEVDGVAATVLDQINGILLYLLIPGIGQAGRKASAKDLT